MNFNPPIGGAGAAPNNNYVLQTLQLLSSTPPNDLRRNIFETEVSILFVSPNQLCLNPEFEHCSAQDLPSDEELLQFAEQNAQRKAGLMQDRLAVPHPGLLVQEERHPLQLDYSLQLYPASFLNYIACHLKYSCTNVPPETVIRSLPLIKRIGSPSAFGEVYTTTVDITIPRPEGFIRRPPVPLTSLHFGLGDAMVLKTFKSGDPLQQCINANHELFVGETATNFLRLKTPNWVYTFGFVQCSELSDCPRSSSNPNFTYPVLPIEFVADAKSLRSQYQNFSPPEYASILSQTFGAEGQAYEEHGFVHQDLHDENILDQTAALAGFNQQQPAQQQAQQQLYLQYSDGRWLVPFRQHLPRIIDYGLSTVNNPHTGQPINFVSTLSPSLGQFHFISDIYKLLAFGIWTTSYPTASEREKYFVVRRINIEIFSNLFVYLSRTLQLDPSVPADRKPAIEFYFTMMLANSMYRLFYPRQPVGPVAQPPPAFRERGIEQILLRLQSSASLSVGAYGADGTDSAGASEASATFTHYLYVLAMFEYVNQEIERVSRLLPPEQAAQLEDAAPMFTRPFNPLKLVDYLYPPRLEGVRLMETTYLRARGDRTAQQVFPVIGAYLQAVDSTDIFNRIRQVIGVSNYREYDTYVAQCAAFLQRALPTMDTFIEQVLLDPVSPVANVEIRNLFRGSLLSTARAQAMQIPLANIINGSAG